MKVWERILADLRREEWTCGSYWYANYTPTFSQRISLDLKPRGYVIASRPCKRHEHRGVIHEYKLMGEPAPTQSRLAGIA